MTNGSGSQPLEPKPGNYVPTGEKQIEPVTLGLYCRHCGAIINRNAVVCIKCGAPVGKGDNFCFNCGKPVVKGALVCLSCGANLKSIPGTRKSKLAAGLLGIFLGFLGVHRFYLGYIGVGLTQLILSIIGIITSCSVVGAILWAAVAAWGFIEGILILTGTAITKDAKGLPLKD